MFFSFFYSFFIIDRFFLRRSYHVFCMVKSCNNHVVVVIQQICFLFFSFAGRHFFCGSLFAGIPAACGHATIWRNRKRVLATATAGVGGSWRCACAGQHACAQSALVHINGSRKKGLIKGGRGWLRRFLFFPEQKFH